MTVPKKRKRQYNSTRREAQARETRHQILEAARELFIVYGYTGATIEAIAKKAGVAPETIFAVFGNKRTILAKLIQVAVRGDDQTIPLLERPERQIVLQEPDPRRALDLFAEDIFSIQERVSPVFEIMRSAAKTEPDIDELLQNILGERLNNLAIFVRHLSAHTALREGLDTLRATETVWAITSAEVFNLLTVDRGWSREEYVHWLSDSLARLLLPQQKTQRPVSHLDEL